LYYRPFEIKEQSYVQEIYLKKKRRAGGNNSSTLFMISTTQDVADITSFRYPSQSTFTMNTSRKDERLYRRTDKNHGEDYVVRA
jgi:hypothetical protein